MKRPLVPAFLFMGTGICLCMAGLPPGAAVLLYGLSSLCAVLVRLKGNTVLGKNPKLFIHLFIFLILFFIGYFNTYIHDTYDNGALLACDGQKAHFGGRISKVSGGSYSCRIFLDNCIVEGKRILNGIVLETESLDYETDGKEHGTYGRGDYVEGYAVLGYPLAPENPGQFDMRAYYKSQGYIYYVTTPEIVLCTPNKNPVIALSETVKSRLKAVYAACCNPQDAGVFGAVVLGDKSGMDEELSDLFSAGGIGHILAISGLHISIIGMGLYRLLRKIGTGYPAAALISGVLVVFYGIMTGNSVSAVRAVIMFSCAVYAQVIGRTYDILSAVSLAAVVVLIRNPYMIAGGGFLLSFLAIAGASVVSEGFFGSRLKKLTGTLAIQLATLPVILWFYYEIPIYSFLLNLLVVPLMTIVMASALLTGASGCLFVPGGRFFAGAAHYIIRLYEQVCRLTLSLPGSVFVAGRPDLWQIAVYALGVLVFSNRHKLADVLMKSRRLCLDRYDTAKRLISSRWLRSIGIVCLAVSVGVLLYRNRDGLEMVILSLGQGDGIYINMPDGTAVFIDGGSSSKDDVYERVIEPFLKSKGIRQIEYLFLSHNDSDHYSGWAEAALSENARIKIKNLVLNEADYKLYQKEAAGESKVNIEGIPDIDIFGIAQILESAGTQVSGAVFQKEYQFKDTRLISINRTKHNYNGSDNDNSTVLLLIYKDKSILFTGDISSKQEEGIAAEIKRLSVKKLTVLKVAHHGSQYSTSEEFLGRIKPDLAVISCGRFNRYGHPHPDTLKRLEESGCRIYITPKEGAIILYTDGEELRVEGFLE